VSRALIASWHVKRSDLLLKLRDRTNCITLSVLHMFAIDAFRVLLYK